MIFPQHPRWREGLVSPAVRSLRGSMASWRSVLLLLPILLLLLFWQPSPANAPKFKLSPPPPPQTQADFQDSGEGLRDQDKQSPGDDDIEQMDVYGVVLSVKNGGALPQPGRLAHPMASGGQSHEVIQKVTVRLDLQSRIQGLKDMTVTVDNVLGENPAYNIPLKPGARVLLNMERSSRNGAWSFYIANRDRTPSLMILGAVLILAVLMIGGPEVSKHMLLAAVMLMGIYKALFPAVLSGSGGLLWTLLMCFMFTILGSFVYQIPHESASQRVFSREQSVVILGTMSGLLILGLLMWVMHLITPLDGYSSEGLASLWYRSPQMDYWALFMAGVLIGYQGLIFYLCWMLAQNRRQEGEHLDFAQRFHIGMLRGRRLLGPMLSSLFLFFMGLFLSILLQMQGTPTAQFMNLESTASILAFVLAGGLTLILTVPVTALISAWVLTQPEPSPHKAPKEAA